MFDSNQKNLDVRADSQEIGKIVVKIVVVAGGENFNEPRRLFCIWCERMLPSGLGRME